MRFLGFVSLVWVAILGLELLGFFWLAVGGYDATAQFWIFYLTVGVGVPIVLGHEICHRLHEREEKKRAHEKKRSFHWKNGK